MDELASLIEKLLSGQLTPREAQRLESLLENDPDARQRYIEQCQLHARLEKDPRVWDLLGEHASFETVESDPSRSWLTALPSRFGAYASAAAAIVVVFSGVYLFRSADPPIEESAVEAAAYNAAPSPQKAYDQAEFLCPGT